MILAAAATLLCASCAKIPQAGKNDANKKFFDSWLFINHPDAARVEPGVYVIKDEAGKGALLGDEEASPYVYIEYTVRDLSGKVTSTSEAKMAQQIGTYEEGNYYGPNVFTRGEGYLSIGVESALTGMRIGGLRSTAIPGWLTTTLRYKNEEQYLKECSGTDAIYEIRLIDQISDMNKWQIDSVQRYISHNFPPTDSLKYGFYFIQTQAPSDTASFKEGDELNINYTGMLLNGTVFDTSVEKVAKDNGLYKSGTEYGPKGVTFADTYSEIKLGGSTVIDGFSYCISKMKKGEKATCIFISDLGYKSSSTSTIPGFSPLRFDIEMIGKKE